MSFIGNCSRCCAYTAKYTALIGYDAGASVCNDAAASALAVCWCSCFHRCYHEYCFHTAAAAVAVTFADLVAHSTWQLSELYEPACSHTVPSSIVATECLYHWCCLCILKGVCTISVVCASCHPVDGKAPWCSQVFGVVYVCHVLTNQITVHVYNSNARGVHCCCCCC